MKILILTLALTALVATLCTGCVGAGLTRLGLNDAAAPVPSLSSVQPSPVPSVREAVKWQARLLWVGGLLCWLAAAGLAWGQMYFMAIKFFIAGLLLPVVGTLWSLYYAWVIAAALVAVAVIAWIHWRVVLTPLARDLLAKATPK